MSTSQYLRSIGASSEWVTHDSPTPCTIRESDTVWVLVYCSPSMMHKIGAICTHPMRFALSSIREENCNADRATTTTTPYREHATCGTLICCSNSSYPRMAPIVCALIFRWSLLPKQGASADRKLHATYICTKFEQSIVLTGTHSARPSEYTRLTLAFVFVVVIVGRQMARPLIEWISDIWLN